MRPTPKKLNERKKFLAGLFLGLMFMSVFAFVAFSPRQAEAFPGEALAAAVWKEIRDQVRALAELSYRAGKEFFKTSKDILYKNTLRIYLTQLAEDTATYVASAGTGQKPLFITDPNYFKKLNDAALGDYLDRFATNAYGVNLCDLGPDTKIKINLSLRAEINPNFCTDGCQRDYEKKLKQPSYLLKVNFRDKYQQILNAYKAERAPIANRNCKTYTTQAQCDADSDCDYCGALPCPGPVQAVGCNVSDLDRAFTQSEIDDIEVVVVDDLSGSGGDPEYSTRGLTDLSQYLRGMCGDLQASSMTVGKCLGLVNEDIQADQQKYENERKRCVNLCTATKATARCSFTQIKEQFAKVGSDYATSWSKLKEGVNEMFDPNQNEVGQYLVAFETAREEGEAASQREKEILDNSEIGPVRSSITGSIITPGTLTRKAAEKPVEEAGKDTTTYTGSPFADAIGVFTDTLTKKLIERIFNREKGGFTGNNTPSLLSGGYNSGGITAARAQFAKSFTPNLTRTSQRNVNVTTDLQQQGVIDQDFLQAIEQKLTVEEAINKGLLHGEWWFGYNNLREQPETGNNGYRADSFPILRVNRVVPVGWEIAAQYIKSYDQGALTLNQVIEKFNDSGSPYYRLVDPKWVLKAPLALCAKQGYGNDLVDGSCQSSETITITNKGNPQDGDAANACDAGEHDTNGDGKCNTDDPPIFENTCERAQTCVDQQTCVRESLDGKSCEEYGYCSKELPIWRFPGQACSSQFVSCQAFSASNGEQVSYLTNTVDRTSCSADTVGCQWFCQAYDVGTKAFSCTASAGAKTYFDRDVQQCGSNDEGCSQVLSMTNGANIAPNSSFEYYSEIPPVATQSNFANWEVGGSNQTCGAQSFTDQVSASGAVAMRLQQLPTACAGDGRQYAQTTIPTGRPLGDRTFSFSVQARALNAPCAGSLVISTATGASSVTVTPTITDSYQVFSGTVSFPAASAETTLRLRFGSINNCPVVYDEVKVEEGDASTGYSDYGASAVNIKIAPPHLTCTGDPTTDPVECAKFASQCTQGDVGCDMFTPVNGGIPIPAKATDADICPAAFVGCRSYQEVAQNPLQKVPDPLHATRIGDPDTSLIAESGQTCQARYVGCEEYTNLAKASAGGEAKEYFTRVQQCVTTADPEIRNYFSWVGSESNGFELKRWQLKKTNVAASNAPCTNLAASDNPNAACIDNTSAETTFKDCRLLGDFPSNPSCFEFFDEFGGAHYRYIEEVIFGTATCEAHRNTIDGRTYYFDVAGSESCPAQFAGCREYKGAGANNTSTVFTSTFESKVKPNDDWQNATVTTESTTFGGHSMSPGVLSFKTVTLEKNQLYILSFWGKSTGGDNLVAAFDNAPATETFAGAGNPPVALTNEWQLYRLGPVELTWDTSELQIGNGPTSYIDNIVLTKTTDSTYLIKGTAASCTGYENCDAYRNRAGQTSFLKSFSRLCSSQTVGCEAMIDTHNSSTPAQTIISDDQWYWDPAVGDYVHYVPQDSVRFLVNDPKKYCSVDAKGCQAMGEPSLDQNLNVKEHSTVYLKNNPDDYSSILCPKTAVGCSEYKVAEDQASLAYFKDPKSRVCDYRTDVGTSGLSGWFKTGTEEPCPVADPNPWVYSCPAEQSTCREYFAPKLYDNPATPGEQSYYYLDSSLAKTSCPQGVDPRNSCLGFQDQNAGVNTIRPKLDPNDTQVVTSQSCVQCSSDANSCGRSGSAPCCKWDAANCSIDRATGSDAAAPYYCLYQETDTDFDGNDTVAGCTLDIVGAFAVPNYIAPSGDPNDHTGATNCGAAGQPACFRSDFSDYDPSKRYCGDFACNVNIVLPVTADRICDQWLACTSEQTVTKDGKQQKICTERALRDAAGFLDQIGDNQPENLVKNSPSEVRDLGNYSGFTNAGIFTSSGNLVNGLYPYSQMTEEGLYGATVEVPDSDFEATKISVGESPVTITTVPPGGTPWIDVNTFEWKTTFDSTGKASSQITLEKSNLSTQFSNQNLNVTSRSTAENGASAVIDAKGELEESIPGFMLSFKAKKTGTLARGIRMVVSQDLEGELWWDGAEDGLQLELDWKTYVIELRNVPGPKLNPSGGPVKLTFLHKTGNVPGEAFQIDDVQLKPVLHIQDAKSRAPVSGLYGQYFQAQLKEAVGSQNGLAAEFWNQTNGAPGSNLPNPNTPNGASVYTKFLDNVVNYSHPAFPTDATSFSIKQGTCSGGGRNGLACINNYSCPTNAPVAPNFTYNGPFFNCTYGANPEIGTAFSVRYTGGIYINNSDENRFYFNRNDGAKFYVEDMNTDLFNNATWGPSACGGVDVVLKDMPVGWHPVKIEWYNQSGDGGNLQFGWHQGQGGLAYSSEFTQPTCSASCGLNTHVCTNGTGGSIVSSTSLVTALTTDTDKIFTDGTLVGSAVDKIINFSDFDARLLEKAKRGDAVGVRWEGEILIDDSNPYTFTVRHKDGFRLYIDNFTSPIGQDWAEGAVRNTNVNAGVLSTGWHSVRIEFFKGLDFSSDIATMMFGWNRAGSGAIPGSGAQIVPESHLRSFPESPTGFVPRECRSYPQSDSVVCDYEDSQSGVVYRGFKGYCVERDPRDPSVCMTWYPIDALAGEVNVFGQQSQSLTRAPLYICAETQKKPAPFGLPRYVCAGKETGNNERCELIAFVDKLKPRGYDLTTNDWQFGIPTAPTCKNGGQQNNDATDYGNTSCTGGGDITECALAGQWRTTMGNNWSGTFAWDNAAGARDELLKYYDNVQMYGFDDDGSSSNRCSSDAWQDDGPTGGDDCDDGNGDECNYYVKSQLDAGANWEADESFPRQCKTLVQVTKATGESTPWTAKVVTGNYTTPPGHPTLFEQGTACSPFGALPVIKTPQDIVNCIPNPTDPPQFGCTVNSGVCLEVDNDGNANTDPPGECLIAPLELYHPDNPDNKSGSSICSETRLGGAFYSCGAAGICKTCIEGDRRGLLCVDNTDCPGTTNPTACRQTFGINEVLGQQNHTFTPLNIPPTTVAYSGIARIKEVFARAYSIWTWDATNRKYVLQESLQREKWGPPDTICAATNTHTVSPNEYCAIRPTVSGIVLKGGYTNGTDVILSGSNKTIDLTFNFTIDPEQQPLKNISIDWGDSDPKPLYKSGAARKLYRCNASGKDCSSCYGAGQLLPYTDPATSQTTNVCVYPDYPRVLVRDNWDWCNDTTATTLKCSGDSATWNTYAGRIIVKP